MYETEIQRSTDYCNGLSSDTVPFPDGSGKTGLVDELLASYGEAETRRALDRILDDAEDYHESGAELENERRHIGRLHDRLESELPSTWDWCITPDVAYRRWGDGRRIEHREWRCFLYADGNYNVACRGYGPDPDAAVEAALAQYRTDPAFATARRQAQGEEVDRMAESDV